MTLVTLAARDASSAPFQRARDESTVVDPPDERTTCEHHSRTSAHGCPSARSPHEVRSGSITCQLHRGLSKDVVAARVNATIAVIERHYDQARQLEEYRERRAEHLDKLGIDDENEEDETA
ncbi:MAG: hypothetical protein ABEJ61_11425 [Haloferacaceae archaeon]